LFPENINDFCNKIGTLRQLAMVLQSDEKADLGRGALELMVGGVEIEPTTSRV
jgi:hypothetical protein